MMHDYAKTSNKLSDKASRDKRLLLPASFVVIACSLLAFTLSGPSSQSVSELADIQPPSSDPSELNSHTTLGSMMRAPGTPQAPAQLTELPKPVTTIIRSGDTLAGIFNNHDIGPLTVHELVRNTEHGKSLNRIKPGQKLEFTIDPEGNLKRLTFQTDLEKEIIFTRTTDDQTNTFSSTSQTIQYEARPAFAKGIIDDSFFLAGAKAGLNDNVIMELTGIFGWDIDFGMDIRKGDTFTVLYEQLFQGDKKIKNGNILAAEFINNGRRFSAIRYEDSNQQIGYYTEDGKNLKKTFLRSPVAFSRISSRFSLGRKHPILHRIRAHKGVDYAAKRGTPIKAVGDGKVIFSGRKGGYGKVVILQHGKYSTLYAHMHRIGKKIRVGKKVKQGQVIGSVGSTGLATGPHLHYEFRVNGVHKNPLTVKFPSADPLPKGEMARYKAHSQKLLADLRLRSGETQLASSDTQPNRGG